MRVSQRRLLVFVLAVALAAAMLPFPGPGSRRAMSRARGVVPTRRQSV